MRISALSLKVLCENFNFLSQTAITVVLRQLWHNTLPRDRLELNQVYTCFRLLVGAPKEKAESGVSANETGDVYACPITADRKDCRRLNLLSSSKFPDIHTSHEVFLGLPIYLFVCLFVCLFTFLHFIKGKLYDIYIIYEILKNRK